MKAFKLFTLLLLVALLPGYAQSAVFEVTIDENGFDPVFLEIDKGDTVRWVNKGTSAHSATSGAGVADGFFDSGLLNSDESFEHTFELPIGIVYFDSTNSSRTGRVRVQGVAISPGDSLLVTKLGFNLLLLLNVRTNGAPYLFSISVNGVQVFKGTLLELVTSPFVQDGWGLPEGGEVFVIPVPAELPVGIHIVNLDVTAPDGQLVASDKAVYTVLRVAIPQLPSGINH